MERRNRKEMKNRKDNVVTREATILSKTIKVTESNHQALTKLKKHRREPYDEVISRLLEHYDNGLIKKEE